MFQKDWTLESLDSYRRRLTQIAKTILGADCPAIDSIVDDAIKEVRMQVTAGKAPTLLRTFIFRVVVNKTINWQRSHRPPENVTDPAPLKLDDERDRLMELMQSCLNKLRADDRTLLVLIDIEQLERKEVAEMLGISLSALNSRHYRARNELRRHLD